jgi:metal-responsive CopG/Arc/MetJ family transcriptional regulator
MEVRTSITLSEEILQAIDKPCGSGSNRSRFIAQALRDALDHKARPARDARDLETIKRVADDLNREARDVLSFQADSALG